MFPFVVDVKDAVLCCSVLKCPREIRVQFHWWQELYNLCFPERRSGSGVTSHDDQEMHTTTRKEIQRQGIMLEHDYIISIYITYIYILHMFKLSHLLAFRDAIAFCRPSRLCVSLARCGSDEFS